MADRPDHDLANRLATELERSQNAYIAKMSDGHNSIVVRSKDDELAECYRLMAAAAEGLRVLAYLAAVGSPEDAVLSWLKGRSFGSIRVNEVTFALDQSADGQPLVRFTVTLDDPEPGQETWPFDDIQSMLRSIDDQAVAEGVESRWSTSFQQTSPEDFSTDDDLSEGAPW